MHPLVSSCLDGYNITILAYGQTGSGKSFTMGSDEAVGILSSDDGRGIIPRYVHTETHGSLGNNLHSSI